MNRKVVEFYVPDLFQKKVRWTPADQRGQVIDFQKGKASAAKAAEDKSNNNDDNDGQVPRTPAFCFGCF
jgi:hypothetical protein